LNFGARGSCAPLAGLRPATAASASGRVKSRRPDYSSETALQRLPLQGSSFASLAALA